MIDVIVQGCLLGGLYSLFALGLSLMFGVMRLTNIAQGDLVVLAAFAAIAMAPMLGGNIGLIALLLLPLAGLTGYGLQHWVLNRSLSRDPLPSLVATFGLSIVIQNALLEGFSATPRSLDAGTLSTRSIEIVGDLRVGVLPALILLAALLCTAGLQQLFARTALGRSFRAVSDDREVAELMGLDARRIYAWATAIAFALIAVAGLFQSMRTTVSPADGSALLLFAFESVIIGGMGSFWGSLVGAMVLGISQQLGFAVDPGWGVWLGHLVFLAVLVVKPSGLFPRTK